MLAVSERIDGCNGTPDQTIWHKPVGRIVDEWQNIACSATEGINSPWVKQNVPIRLKKEHEAWCSDCLNLVRQR
ncbi:MULTISPECIES: hypothetical protein [Streptomyces]|uniref:hypothetical protein n=1 Tax=Streptomyces TaxID=1883 RepID=UPI000BF0CDD0|nr:MULTISPECIES: hypothetical protein [Streptomyces]UPT46774.1 hypothetical protein MWG59_38655 [Streptomyces sp. WAC00303]WIY80891.1 hypothetical protein QPM16_38285 [Streptomyces anulatus]